MSSLWSCATSQWDAAATLCPVCRSYSDTEQPAASREQGFRETNQERSRLSEQQSTWVEVRRAACFPVAVAQRGMPLRNDCSRTAYRRSAGGRSKPLALVAWSEL